MSETDEDGIRERVAIEVEHLDTEEADREYRRRVAMELAGING